MHRGLILWLVCSWFAAVGAEPPPPSGTDRIVDLGRFVVVPNLDDDNTNGVVDALEPVNPRIPLKDDEFLRFEIPEVVVTEAIRLQEQHSAVRFVEINRLPGGRSEVVFEAIRPKKPGDTETIVWVLGTTARYRARIDTAPFALLSSLAQPTEIFIVDVPDTAPVRMGLEGLVSSLPGGPKVTAIRVPQGDPRDVWIQDATEIGVFAGSSVNAALHGLRGQHYRKEGDVQGGPLDKHFASQFPGPNRAVIEVGESLPKRKWIDWFGNLEVTPPHQSRQGKSYPFGRIVTGKQEDLSMHPEIMRFLEAQGIQWPPIVLDTGFLLIGHVDELVNFVPSDKGFRMIVASPSFGESVLREWMAKGHGALKMLEGRLDADGKPAERTVREIVSNRRLLAANRRAAEVMSSNLQILCDALGVDRSEVIELPVLFDRSGLSVWPNVVNGLVLGRHIVCPKPFGPIVDGQDQLEALCRKILREAGMEVSFVDAYNAYSRMAGEVHCGTNAIRQNNHP